MRYPLFFDQLEVVNLGFNQIAPIIADLFLPESMHEAVHGVKYGAAGLAAREVVFPRDAGAVDQ